jgi:integrase
MPTRHQDGYIYKKKNRWYVRYYERVTQKDGSVSRIQISRSVAPVCHEYRTKGAVSPLVAEILKDINSNTVTVPSTLSLEQFVDDNYLPYTSSQKRPSTYRGYRNLWKRYLKKRCGKIRLRDFRTLDGERVLADIARQNDLARNTLKHIKNLLSGIFKHAKRLGCINGVNPMQDVSIPKSRPAGQTYAYSLEEITKMISILPQPAATVVATAAFTGMRKGEIRGFVWENYHDDAIWVTQSVWERFVTEPKTQQSISAIPVIGPLAELLQKHREATGNPQAGFVFQSRNYKHKAVPLAPNSLLKWHIKPKLVEAKMVWRGWHAFRRGLATNLYRLGVPDKTIQAILRHSNLSTTMNSYVKSVATDAVAAMRTFEAACRKNAPRRVVRKPQIRRTQVEQCTSNAPQLKVG